MNPLTRLRELAQQLALQNAPHNGALKFDLYAAVQAENLQNILPQVWSEIETKLDHDPALALALARVSHVIAKRARKNDMRALADLALVRALNMCGEFDRAARLCPDVARRFEKQGDTERVMRVWLEAAWAETYLGNLQAAENDLERIRTMGGALPSGAIAARRDPAVKQAFVGLTALQLRGEWIWARILRERGHYGEALELFLRIRSAYQAQGAKHNAMRVRREIGHTHARMQPAAALKPLRTARAFFVRNKCPLEVAHCDYFIAQALTTLGRYRQAKAHLNRAQRAFRRQSAAFFEGCCELDFGYLLWFLDEHQKMLIHSQRARTLFLDLRAIQETASSEINIGVALVALDRYAEAIPYFESGMEHSLTSGRTTKAAVCLLNLGDIYLEQSQYGRALDHFLRARELLEAAGNVERIIACDLRLAEGYLGVAAHKQASVAVERAFRLAAQEKMTMRRAHCELYRAQLLLLRGQARRATAALGRARTYFARRKQTSHLAWCDRLLAEIPSPHRSRSLARLAASRQVFRRRQQIVEVAHCDLARGELYLRWHEWRAASGALARAHRILDNDFPAQHARILYGLARIARAQKQRRRALDYLVQGAHVLAQVRRTVGLESLSNSFSGSRQKVIREGLLLARREQDPAAGLALVEAAKAQTFSQALPTQAWRLQSADERVRELEERERALHAHLEQERQNLSPAPDTVDSRPRQKSGSGISGAAGRRRVHALTVEYEQVAQELRLARRSFAGVPTLDPFVLAAFRAAATKRWGDAWLALDYFLEKDRLYVVTVDRSRVNLHVRRWGWHEQYLLQQVTHLHPDMRELIFNGTLRGRTIPSFENPLALLSETLLPPEALELEGATLLVAPHQALHQFPFQALEIRNQFLAERVTLAYTPTLQTYTQVCENAAPLAMDTVLLSGIQTFEGNLGALAHTRREVNQIRRQYPGATVLWQDRATRSRLLEWNRSGRLRDFSILHFATHATVQADAPHLSAIHLGQQELTVPDISNFVLDARLVTLSACSGNIGTGGSGDEWVSLARSFFYAGARALVASLWQVGDESTTKLMGAFYRGLSKGKTISASLALAQLELIRAGASPYQWAPFVAIGDV